MKGGPFSCKSGILKGPQAGGASPYKHLLSTHPPPPPKALHTATSQITYHTLSPPQRPLCVPRVLSIFSITAIFIGIPSGSLCGSRREYHIPVPAVGRSIYRSNPVHRVLSERTWERGYSPFYCAQPAILGSTHRVLYVKVRSAAVFSLL